MNHLLLNHTKSIIFIKIKWKNLNFGLIQCKRFLKTNIKKIIFIFVFVKLFFNLNGVVYNFNAFYSNQILLLINI